MVQQFLQQLINGLMLGGVYAICAVAFTLTIGMLNFLNFTIPALFMLSAMLTWAMTHLGMHWLVAVGIGILVAIVASLVIERFTYRYMKAKYGDATEHALPLVSSLGFLIIFEHAVISIWGTDAQVFATPFTDPNLRVGGLIVGLPQLFGLGLAIAIVWFLSALLKRTRTGRALRAIAENPDASTLMGVEVQRIVPIVFVITGILSALAGVLYTISYRDVTPYIGDAVAADAIAGMVIGGLGNVWGAIIGGLIVGVVKVLSIAYGGAAIEKIPVWGLLLLILVVKPTGLFGHTKIGKGKF
ncbi:MAG: branched-chain amino acid ABC transporter permease [Alphaproteobacteria bacterium]